MITFTEFKSGVAICNTTPHPITIQDMDGTLIEVPVSELVNAKVVEEEISDLFVTTKFKESPDGRRVIGEIKDKFLKTYGLNETSPKLIILGSVIAAQAYPEEVFGMVPVPGYERVAPAEKRMRCDKFTMYPTKEVK